MQLAIISANQVFIMFILIVVGYMCFKVRIIDDIGTAQMTELLLKVVFPSVILTAFTVPLTEDRLRKFFIALALTFASHVIGIIVAYFAIGKKAGVDSAVESFATIYTNNGFMGIPLIAGLFGNEGVFYATAYICIGNLFTWTHGVMLMENSEQKKSDISLLKIIKSPAIVAIIIGMIMLLFKISLPKDISKVITCISNMNTPLAMFIVGAILAQTNIISAFKDLKVYKIVILTNLVIPLIAAILYSFLAVDRNLIINNIISTACPTSCLAVIFSKKYNRNIKLASEIFTVSNLLTIVTLPVIVIIIDNMFRR